MRAFQRHDLPKVLREMAGWCYHSYIINEQVRIVQIHRTSRLTLDGATGEISMPTRSPVFVAETDHAWIDLGGGVKRKVLCYDQSVMLVRVVFEKGAIGPAHQHPHIQCSLVASGRFEMTIGDETRILEAGDSFIVPSKVIHSALALEAGELVDTFAPMREEFV
jgi:quercetin dioxygenase-like cupin family protein